MKKVIINLGLIYILFSNILFSIFEFPQIISYWDEIIEIIVIMIGILLLKSKIQKKYFISILIIVIILICGLVGNIIFNYVQIEKYIFRDVLGFLKFPITFLILKTYNFDETISKYIDEKFIYCMKFMIIVIFVFGVLSLFIDIGMSQNEIRHGIRPYQFLFSHPTYLVQVALFLLLFLDSSNKNNFIYSFMLLMIIVLTMRTKGIGVVAVYVFMKYAGIYFKKYKIICFIGGILVLYSSTIQKVQLYASYSSSPREALYKGSLFLANKLFPFGSGFASFASHISAKSNSKVYDYINIPYYWVENGNQYAVLGDAGFAYYIGQFGYFAFIAFLFFLYRLYKLSLDNIQNKFPIQILWLYVIIALTSESILINNGIELCFMFLILCGLIKKREDVKEI